MKQILVIFLITLLALGTACAWISPSSDTTSEGIKVHGHWTVTVTNPDGTVDAMHEFNNEITDPGKYTLVNLLNDPNYRLKENSEGTLRKWYDTTRIEKWHIYLAGQAGTTKAGIPGTQLNSNLYCYEESPDNYLSAVSDNQKIVILPSDAQPNAAFIHKEGVFWFENEGPSELHLSSTCSVAKASYSATITEIGTLPTIVARKFEEASEEGKYVLRSKQTTAFKFTKHILQPSEYIKVEEGQLLMFAVKISFG